MTENTQCCHETLSLRLPETAKSGDRDRIRLAESSIEPVADTAPTCRISSRKLRTSIEIGQEWRRKRVKWYLLGKESTYRSEVIRVRRLHILGDDPMLGTLVT
jgi:hypothetical protein